MTRKNLNKDNIPEERYKLYTCNGVDLQNIAGDTYDFIMSTIALQHICVYDIRYSYLKEFHRLLKSDGLLSFQMGLGGNKKGARKYYENYYEAKRTNSFCDVIVDNPDQIVNDLKKIGFTNIEYEITDSFPHGVAEHPKWIFVKAKKN